MKVFARILNSYFLNLIDFCVWKYVLPAIACSSFQCESILSANSLEIFQSIIGTTTLDV